jgi:hypothetical protein
VREWYEEGNLYRGNVAAEGVAAEGLNDSRDYPYVPQQRGGSSARYGGARSQRAQHSAKDASVSHFAESAFAHGAGGGGLSPSAGMQGASPFRPAEFGLGGGASPEGEAVHRMFREASELFLIW